MAIAALLLYGVWLSVAFGVRAFVQWRRTGDTGFRRFDGTAGSAEWWAGILFIISLIAGVLAPTADITGVLEPIALLDTSPLRTGGAVLACLGITATVACSSPWATPGASASTPSSAPRS